MKYDYYRQNLSGSQQRVYSSVLSGLLQNSSEINIGGFGKVDMEAIRDAVLSDNPEIFNCVEFLLSSSAFSQKLIPKYIYGPSQSGKLKDQIQKESDRILNEIEKPGRPEDNILRLHEYIVKNITYRETGIEAHTLVGPLINKTGVCEGISKLVKYLCDRMNIPCFLMSGIGRNAQAGISDRHSWNYIKSAKGWYAYDFTFDNTINVQNPCRSKVIMDYYCITDEEIRRDHSDFRVSIALSNVKADYFAANRRMVSNDVELRNLFYKEAAGLETDFKVAPVWRDFDVDKELNELLNNQALILKGIRGYNYMYNDILRTCYVRLSK